MGDFGDQTYPAPGAGYWSSSEGGPQPAARKSGGRSCLIAVIITAVVLVIGVLGCGKACEQVARQAFKNSYPVQEWGWSGGKGPKAQQGPMTMMGGSPAPWDTAPEDAGKDAAAKAGLVRIHKGFERFQAKTGRPYGAESDGAWELALAPYLRPWPENPWSGQPMHEGRHRGDVSFDDTFGNLDLVVYISP